MARNIYYQVKWVSESYRKYSKQFDSIADAEEYYCKVMRYPSRKSQKLISVTDGLISILMSYNYYWRGL